MNFKPTKWRVLVSIGVIVCWYIFLFFLSTRCVGSPPPPYSYNKSVCNRVFDFDLLPNSHCKGTCPGPTPLSLIFFDLIIILLPGIFSYLYWNILENKNKKSNKKKR